LLPGNFDRRLAGAKGGGGLINLLPARPFPQQRQAQPGLLDTGESEVLTLPGLIQLFLGRQFPGNQIGDSLEFDASVIEVGLHPSQLRFPYPQLLNAGARLQDRQRRLRRLGLGGGIAQR
jgi:hypothetical protein